MSNQIVHGSLPMSGEKQVMGHGRSPWRVVGMSLFALFLFLLLGASTTSAASQTIPTISIVSVVPDQTATIQTHNYPTGQIFTVRMNYMGTAGLGGEVVGTFDSSRGDATATYPIPNFLKGQQQIAIRLDSAQGYYSFNWFWNNTTQPPGSGGQPPAPPSYVGIPTFSIVSVATDTNVTILTNNFPPNQLFDVTMGLMYTQGIGGIKVGEINSGAGGAIQQTFNIPAELRGQTRIAIRAQTRHANPFYAYNWFWNNTTGTGGLPTPTPPIVTPPTTPPVTGIPTIKICQVVRDGSVQIQTANYPANMNFSVTMGPMGTQGLLGYPAGSFNSGNGGTARFTITIPDGVKGLNQIAIRAQGSPYFSYNWFWNTTTTADFCSG
ncbi:MAG TPA: hypothetical protein PLD25_20025 [Chloroflexota bacterium]|nr:hypothetical protein [Chloroflexota bacterium]HUM70126.1 hypothetical protein [Chloroflexota bacterium]